MPAATEASKMVRMTDDAPAVPSPLQPVDESWQRGLAIVAHPDDLEFGAAAAIARWTGQGKQIVYVLLTSGEAGIDGIDPAEAGPLREAGPATVPARPGGFTSRW